MPMLSLSRIVAYWAEIQPDRVAIDHEGASVTWAEFEARTNRLARAYEALGVGQDQFVTIALPNGIEFIEACFATWKLGATPQPISAKLPKLERDQIVELGQPALVVGWARVAKTARGVTWLTTSSSVSPALAAWGRARVTSRPAMRAW